MPTTESIPRYHNRNVRIPKPSRTVRDAEGGSRLAPRTPIINAKPAHSDVPMPMIAAMVEKGVMESLQNCSRRRQVDGAVAKGPNLGPLRRGGLPRRHPSGGPMLTAGRRVEGVAGGPHSDATDMRECTFKGMRYDACA